MPPAIEEDWSDSDEEAGSDVETAVLLGFPDGSVKAESDLKDAAVSRIGGYPAFLPSREPSISSSQCKNCSYPMELLAQIWCPFEDSPHDRALYVWACSRSTCQRKIGSVRAWRGLRFNAEYAAKLEKKRSRNKSQVKVAPPAGNPPSANPFSMKAAAAPSPFGLGDHIFGEVPLTTITPPPQEEVADTVNDNDDDRDSDASSASEHSLITAMATTTLEESPWTAAPSYQPMYLSTSSEYLPPAAKSKPSSDIRVEDPADNDDKKTKDTTWAFEGYENSLEVDHVFDRFTKRVSYAGEQCLRYELGGVPLPFSSDKVFESIFPAPPQAPLPVTKPDFKVVHTPKRSYSSASIPSCPVCKSSRVFECQIMPNLINVLKSSNKDDSAQKPLTDEQRIKAVQEALKKGGDNASDKRDMEWGTCMIFSCEKDCCLAEEGAKDAKECWREEVVLVQWDE
ncbi:programmed cell death protein 2 [Hygrophoropsis aurantiaca]|uniref:Programmed cell death protein 2 n=1 Tax=Hygrophoropsis aurantiaca TaxID=72124 RepID=A0ACB8ANV8_9AGAM|nr:programmed cell death protein 2 [Hygrophoropsis aurantiaca]